MKLMAAFYLGVLVPGGTLNGTKSPVLLLLLLLLMGYYQLRVRFSFYVKMAAVKKATWLCLVYFVKRGKIFMST